MFTGRQGNEILTLLIIGAEVVDRFRCQVRDAEGDRDRGAGTRDFLEGKAVAHGTGVSAAVLLRDHHPEYSKLTQFSYDFFRVYTCIIVFMGNWFYFASHEIPDHVAYHYLFVSQWQVHCSILMVCRELQSI